VALHFDGVVFPTINAPGTHGMRTLPPSSPLPFLLWFVWTTAVGADSSTHRTQNLGSCFYPRSARFLPATAALQPTLLPTSPPTAHHFLCRTCRRARVMELEVVVTMQQAVLAKEEAKRRGEGGADRSACARICPRCLAEAGFLQKTANGRSVWRRARYSNSTSARAKQCPHERNTHSS